MSESDVDGSSDLETNTKDDKETEKKIREELSSLSFEELLKLKEKVGTKAYNEKIFNLSTSKKTKNEGFKRANKNRPREMSSKVRINRSQISNSVSIRIPGSVPRDPRFDPLCGTFDRKVFKSNYKFVNDIRLKEKKQLEKELKESKDPNKTKKVKLLIQRLDNQFREEKKVEKEKQKEQKEKKEMYDKLKHGEKPVFKKKSVKKLESLIEKYEDLKKGNKLSKHIERRSKKLSVKDRKKFKD